MVMQRVAAAADRGLTETGMVNGETTRVNVFEFDRESLARFAWFVVGYDVAVILWGAYVRATGSGAGCGSHWPLCNGEFLPSAPHAHTAIEFTHRLTSGVSLTLAAILLFWCWRRTTKGDWPRYTAVAAAALLLNEAILGALLVLVDHVGGLDQATTHALFLCLHFGNTLCLLAALAVTARWLSSSCLRFVFVRRRSRIFAMGFGLLAVMITGITGSLASLGDTLFPPDSLRRAVLDDFSASTPTLVRLRAIHPVAAVLGALCVLWLFQAFWRKEKRSIWVYLLPITLTCQIALGAINVFLLAPIWMQMTHLLVAELFWIVLVLASADEVFAPHPSSVPLAQMNSPSAIENLAFNTSDPISRQGGLSS
jgi:cytochrome c oxidase assembly protein subunit 15